MKLNIVFGLFIAGVLGVDEPCTSSTKCQNVCLDGEYHIVVVDGVSQFGCVTGLHTGDLFVRNCIVFGDVVDYDNAGANACTQAGGKICAKSFCFLGLESAKVYEESCESAKGSVNRGADGISEAKAQRIYGC